MAEFLGIGYTVDCSFQPLTASEVPAPIDPASVTQEIVGASGTVEIIDFVALETGISFKLRALTESTVPAKAVVTADADMGEGVSTITAMTSEWTVKMAPADMATHFAMVEGEQQPPAAAPAARARR